MDVLLSLLLLFAQYQTECYCGNEYGALGPLPEEKCEFRCAGSCQAACGGFLANSVYSTGLVIHTTGSRFSTDKAATAEYKAKFMSQLKKCN